MTVDQKKEAESAAPATNKGLFSRAPLAAFGRVTVAALLGGGVASGLLALIIGFPDNIALLIVTASLLVCAGLVATGWRWIPLLAALMSGVMLFQISRQPFVNFHLTHPQSGGFAAFVFDVLIIGFLVVLLGASIGAVVQNYRQPERQTPRWLSSALTGMAGIVIGAILIGAISPSAAAPTISATTSEPTVHMGSSSFLQSSVTVPKGSKLLLVDNGSFFHLLANGTWQNGTPKPADEAGAPAINNVQVTGGTIEIGPFNTAGTYHIYCTVHPGMDLTVVVQ